MNLLKDDTIDLADYVMERIQYRGGVWGVYIEPDGHVILDCATQSSRSRRIPDYWLLGNYNKQSRTAEIQEDLEWQREWMARAFQ
jgi:hypothetical protein